MLTKKEKKSYGAFIDCFLDDCKVVTDLNHVTHIHLTKTGEFPAGLYLWEPRTGVLQDLDGQHIGMLSHKRVVSHIKNHTTSRGPVVLLKHKSSWEDMVEDGQVKSENKEKLDWEWDLGSTDSGQAPEPTPVEKKNTPGSFLKKMFGK